MVNVDGQTETWYYYHFNGLGSVIALSDENGDLVESYSYNVFGSPTIYDDDGEEISASAIGNPYMFTGRRYEQETGLYYYRFRDYHPAVAWQRAALEESGVNNPDIHSSPEGRLAATSTSGAGAVQTSVCSAISRASSTSIPR